MAVDPKKLVAAISPDVYCRKDKKNDVKGIIKESLAKRKMTPISKLQKKPSLQSQTSWTLRKLSKHPFN